MKYARPAALSSALQMMTADFRTSNGGTDGLRMAWSGTARAKRHRRDGIPKSNSGVFLRSRYKRIESETQPVARFTCEQGVLE
jgi:hypothetical protein